MEPIVSRFPPKTTKHREFCLYRRRLPTFTSRGTAAVRNGRPFFFYVLPSDLHLPIPCARGGDTPAWTSFRPTARLSSAFQPPEMTPPGHLYGAVRFVCSIQHGRHIMWAMRPGVWERQAEPMVSRFPTKTATHREFCLSRHHLLTVSRVMPARMDKKRVCPLLRRTAHFPHQKW